MADKSRSRRSDERDEWEREDGWIELRRLLSDEGNKPESTLKKTEFVSSRKAKRKVELHSPSKTSVVERKKRETPRGAMFCVRFTGVMMYAQTARLLRCVDVATEIHVKTPTKASHGTVRHWRKEGRDKISSIRRVQLREIEERGTYDPVDDSGYSGSPLDA